MDLFNDRVAMIQEWKNTRSPDLLEIPKLDGNTRFLTSLMLGSYIQWAKSQYRLFVAKNSIMEDSRLKVAKKSYMGSQFFSYQQLQKLFASKGAKTWDELPEDKKLNSTIADFSQAPADVGDSVNTQLKYNMPATSCAWDESTPDFESSELLPNLSRAIGDGSSFLYIQLYEAVCRGDIAMIKAMTLTHWGPNRENPPLKVAVVDNYVRITPVTLALSHGRLEVARALLQIAQAQYQPIDRVNYVISADASPSDGPRTEFYVAARKRDGTLKIGDIPKVPREAHTIVSPLEILQTPANLDFMLPPQVQKELTEKFPELKPNLCTPRFTAATFALMQNDFDLFQQILILADELETGTAIIDLH